MNRLVAHARREVGRVLPARVRARLRGQDDAAQTVERFHRLYYESLRRTWKNTSWLGVNVLKCPLDLWIYQELLVRLKPEVVVETGTYAGGSALFLATCMDQIGRGRVITIDLEAAADRPRHDRVMYLVGSSVDPGVVERVRAEVADASPVLVILDSDHHRAHVQAELRAYAPLVTVGSYLIVEDTNVNGRPVEPEFGPGPYEAVEEFLAADLGFVRDPDCEKLLMTFNPGGFLYRRRGDG